MDLKKVNLVIFVIICSLMNQQKYCKRRCKLLKFSYQRENGAADTMLLCHKHKYKRTANLKNE